MEADDLLETVEEAVWQRRFAVVRLEVDAGMPDPLLDVLPHELRDRTTANSTGRGPLR